MSVPQQVVELIEGFESGFNQYKHSSYGETQVRVDFINPFFEALGWDMANKTRREVTHEYSLDNFSTKIRPDYCFNAGGDGKIFFVEAKKPSVNLEMGYNPAIQLRRYSWTANQPIGALTDFEELSVYYGRGIEPKTSDGPDVGRLFYCNFKDYADKWDEIYALFSRQAVLDGSLEHHAATAKTKRAIQEVDAVFLNDIESWRSLLACHIALNNPNLTQRELNASVQQTIDRIIFLRICEDRDIEPYGTLKKLLSDESVYQKLIRLFKVADTKYNSGLFHFKDDPKRGESADTLALELNIHDEPLKQIIQRLYFPDGPYAFSVMPADILGQVYERFLGKIIQVNADRSVVVEEKPEVRKAGGVYYTPTYIVDYIVRNTIGKLLEGKTPDNVSSIRVLDPACGSGSFLIRAYQYLLDWHLDWYMNHNPQKHTKGKAPILYQDSNDHWHLTIAERKRILLNNIYGVDIDSQAVEVSKLSLLLKVLEGENSQSMTRQLSLFKERALPDLSNNIKCGNSLIGRDFYSGQQPLFSLDEKLRINAFDWEAEFADIIKAGGFDVVIGNPPYVRIQNMKEWAPVEVEFYKKSYRTASKGDYDIYVVVVEKGLSLLNSNGKLGFILPHKFFNAQYGTPLRDLISSGKHLSEIIHFGDHQIFNGATTYTCLMFLDKSGMEYCKYNRVDDIAEWTNTGKTLERLLSASNITSAEWNYSIGPTVGLFEKLTDMPIKIGDICHLFVGLQTDADDVYILEEMQIDEKNVLCRSKYTGKEHWFENSHLKPFLKGSLNIRRYYFSDVTKRLLFPYFTNSGKSILIDAEEYKSKFPLTWTYLEECSERLMSRNKGKMGKNWYGYVYKKNHTRFDSPKLLVPSIATGSCFTSDVEGNYYFVGSGGGGGGGYGISLLSETEFDYFYLLGILNSSLLSAYLKSISSQFQNGYIALNRQYIEKLPIRPINFSDPSDVVRHTRMVALVQKMLDLNKQLLSTRLKQEIEELKRDITHTDKEIDRLVYELYGLTDEEIAIVENG